MTLQVLMKNHIGENRTVVRIVKGTAGHTIEVVVQDLSVCVGSARDAESRMDLRTVYPMDEEYYDVNNIYLIYI
jgi:hypothetical protein